MQQGSAPLASRRRLLRLLLLILWFFLCMNRQCTTLCQLIRKQLFHRLVTRLPQRFDHLRRHEVPVLFGNLRGVVRQFPCVMSDGELVLTQDLDVDIAVGGTPLTDALEDVGGILELTGGLIKDEKETVIPAHQLVDRLLVVIKVEAFDGDLFLFLFLLRFEKISLAKRLALARKERQQETYHFPNKNSLIVVTLKLLIHSVNDQLLKPILREALEPKQIQNTDEKLVSAGGKKQNSPIKSPHHVGQPPKNQSSTYNNVRETLSFSLILFTSQSTSL